jgi:hypothetical protein
MQVDPSAPDEDKQKCKSWKWATNLAWSATGEAKPLPNAMERRAGLPLGEPSPLPPRPKAASRAAADLRTGLTTGRVSAAPLPPHAAGDGRTRGPARLSARRSRAAPSHRQRIRVCRRPASPIAAAKRGASRSSKARYSTVHSASPSETLPGSAAVCRPTAAAMATARRNSSAPVPSESTATARARRVPAASTDATGSARRQAAALRCSAMARVRPT